MTTINIHSVKLSMTREEYNNTDFQNLTFNILYDHNLLSPGKPDVYSLEYAIYITDEDKKEPLMVNIDPAVYTAMMYLKANK